MPKRRKKSSKFNKLLLLLALICLGVALFGAYTYIQDMRASDTARMEANKEDSSPPEEAPSTTPEESGVGEGEGSEEDGFANLDNEVENQVKNSLLEDDQTQQATTPQNIPVVMNISFNAYSPDKQTYSLGVTFVGDGSVSSCSLTIQSGAGNISSQAPKTPGQHGVSGCRFSNVDLSSLSAPSKTNPWRMLIKGHRDDGQVVTSLERNILSATDLNSLLGS